MSSDSLVFQYFTDGGGKAEELTYMTRILEGIPGYTRCGCFGAVGASSLGITSSPLYQNEPKVKIPFENCWGNPMAIRVVEFSNGRGGNIIKQGLFLLGDMAIFKYKYYNFTNISFR